MESTRKGSLAQPTKFVIHSSTLTNLRHFLLQPCCFSVEQPSLQTDSLQINVVLDILISYNGYACLNFKVSLTFNIQPVVGVRILWLPNFCQIRLKSLSPSVSRGATWAGRLNPMFGRAWANIFSTTVWAWSKGLGNMSLTRI